MCKILKNKYYINTFFCTDKDISDITAHAFGVLLDVPIPFPLKNSNVCKDPDSGVKCPLKKDQETDFKNTFNVDKKTPAVILL